MEINFELLFREITKFIKKSILFCFIEKAKAKQFN